MRPLYDDFNNLFSTGAYEYHVLSICKDYPPLNNCGFCGSPCDYADAVVRTDRKTSCSLSTHTHTNSPSFCLNYVRFVALASSILYNIVYVFLFFFGYHNDNSKKNNLQK